MKRNNTSESLAQTELQTILTSEPEHISHIDDYLGDSHSRFFGRGYKTTNPSLTDPNISFNPTVEIITFQATGSLRLAQSNNWSTKKTKAQRPHLSTVDAIILIGEALQFMSQQPVKDSLVSDFNIASLEITASNEPLEYDARSRFPVGLDLDFRNGCRSAKYSGNVGSLSYSGMLNCTLYKDRGELTERNLTDKCDLSTGYADLYGGYQEREIELAGIIVAGLFDAQATLSISSTTEVEQPQLSFVELFISTLQLGQLLLYRMDHLKRENSNTLWMRKTVLKKLNDRRLNTPIKISTQLRNTRKIQMGGDTWRCADIYGNIQNIFEVTCSVAHKIT